MSQNTSIKTEAQTSSSSSNIDNKNSSVSTQPKENISNTAPITSEQINQSTQKISPDSSNLNSNTNFMHNQNQINSTSNYNLNPILNSSSLNFDSETNENTRTSRKKLLQIFRQSSLELFQSYTGYDIIPLSGKVVVFDDGLPIKHAFMGLVENDIKCGPVQNSDYQDFVGMLTVTDFIDILLHFYYSRHKSNHQRVKSSLTNTKGSTSVTLTDTDLDVEEEEDSDTYRRSSCSYDNFENIDMQTRFTSTPTSTVTTNSPVTNREQFINDSNNKTEHFQPNLQESIVDIVDKCIECAEKNNCNHRFKTCVHRQQTFERNLSPPILSSKMKISDIAVCQSSSSCYNSNTSFSSSNSSIQMRKVTDSNASEDFSNLFSTIEDLTVSQQSEITSKFKIKSLMRNNRDIMHTDFNPNNEHEKSKITLSKSKEKYQFIYMTPDQSLFTGIKLLHDYNIHRLPIVQRDPENTVLCIINHQRLSRFLMAYLADSIDFQNLLTRLTIGALFENGIGTFTDLITGRMYDPVVLFLERLNRKSIPCIPIIDDNENYIDSYTRSDVRFLALDGLFRNLDITIREAIGKHHLTSSSRVPTCRRHESLYTVFSRLLENRKHACVVLDKDNRKVVGIITLGDFFSFFAGDNDELNLNMSNENETREQTFKETGNIDLKQSSNLVEIEKLNKENNKSLKESFNNKQSSVSQSNKFLSKDADKISQTNATNFLTRNQSVQKPRKAQNCRSLLEHQWKALNITSDYKFYKTDVNKNSLKNTKTNEQGSSDDKKDESAPQDIKNILEKDVGKANITLKNYNINTEEDKKLNVTQRKEQADTNKHFSSEGKTNLEKKSDNLTQNESIHSNNNESTDSKSSNESKDIEKCELQPAAISDSNILELLE